MHERNVDVHIASSLTSERILKQIKQKKEKSKIKIDGIIKTLHHNADIDIYNMDFPKSKDVSIVYFGTRNRAYIPNSLSHKINYLDASNTDSFKKSIRLIDKYNVHYCVSAQKQNGDVIIAKPFTKGFTAAILGANVIVNRCTDDAEELLGSDYPYFVEAQDDMDIRSCVEKVEQTFGGPEWTIAQDRMANMKRLVEPSSLAQQMMEIARELGR